MPRNDDFDQLAEIFEDGWVVDADDQESLKFNLYLRSRELQQISHYLEKIMLYSASKRAAWLKENKKVLKSLLQVFAQDSSLSLDGIQLDQETANLSMELAMNLRQTVAMINALFYSNDGLKG